MKLPPALLRLRIITRAQRRISLWLPLFLLWPVLLILLLPVLLFALLATALFPQRLAFIPETASRLYAVLCATRGTHVDISGAKPQVLVSIH